MPDPYEEGRQAAKDKKPRMNPYLSDGDLWNMGFHSEESERPAFWGNLILTGVIVVQIIGLAYMTFCM